MRKKPELDLAGKEGERTTGASTPWKETTEKLEAANPSIQT
jgi:hypothetical protein